MIFFSYTLKEFEFETIDDNNKILIQPQQYTISINTKCLFHGMPSDFHISTSNPLVIDFYYILFDI